MAQNKFLYFQLIENILAHHVQRACPRMKQYLSDVNWRGPPLLYLPVGAFGDASDLVPSGCLAEASRADGSVVC